MIAIMTQEITVDSATSIPPNIGIVNAVAASSSSIRNSDRLPIEPTPPCFHNFLCRRRLPVPVGHYSFAAVEVLCHAAREHLLSQEFSITHIGKKK